jgi:hypothetical protein
MSKPLTDDEVRAYADWTDDSLGFGMVSMEAVQSIASELLSAREKLAKYEAALKLARVKIYMMEAPDYARHWDDFPEMDPEVRSLLAVIDAVLLHTNNEVS